MRNIAKTGAVMFCVVVVVMYVLFSAAGYEEQHIITTALLLGSIASLFAGYIQYSVDRAIRRDEMRNNDRKR